MRGTELFPDSMKPPPVVRVIVHINANPEGADRRFLVDRALQIIAVNTGTLMGFYHAQRQLYQLGNVSQTKVRREFTGGDVTYQCAMGQDTITLNVYPDEGGSGADWLIINWTHQWDFTPTYRVLGGGGRATGCFPIMDWYQRQISNPLTVPAVATPIPVAGARLTWPLTLWRTFVSPFTGTSDGVASGDEFLGEVLAVDGVTSKYPGFSSTSFDILDWESAAKFERWITGEVYAETVPEDVLNEVLFASVGNVTADQTRSILYANLRRLREIGGDPRQLRLRIGGWLWLDTSIGTSYPQAGAPHVTVETYKDGVPRYDMQTHTLECTGRRLGRLETDVECLRPYGRTPAASYPDGDEGAEVWYFRAPVGYGAEIVVDRLARPVRVDAAVSAETLLPYPDPGAASGQLSYRMPRDAAVIYTDAAWT
jgi:hypothetical protein